MTRAALCLLLGVFALSVFGAGHDLTPSLQTARQSFPVVTGNGSGFMAAWREITQNGNAVVSQAVSSGGEPIEGTRTAVEQPRVDSMAIAHSPTDTLVVWIANRNVYARRFSPSGLPINTLTLTPLNSLPSDAVVAWNGSRYFVVWSTGAELAGAFVGPDGQATPARSFFTESSPRSRQAVVPDMAWDGQHFVVVFGERSIDYCTVLCPTPSPDQFRAMRVSANGDAIDSSPPIITGSHLCAHVASSGAESLITLDGLDEVSTIVAHDQTGLTLDAETPLFRWFEYVSSAVVWDGTMYIVGWRYGAGDVSWVGKALVTRSGLSVDYRFADGQSTLPWTWDANRIGMAVNEAGATAFIITAGTNSLPRSRLYLESELAPIPPAPPSPINAAGYFGAGSSHIDWQSDGLAPGFVVEVWESGFRNVWGFYGTAPGDARTITLYSSFIGSLFRVRAFGPGGVSEGTMTSIGSQHRRHASH